MSFTQPLLSIIILLATCCPTVAQDRHFQSSIALGLNFAELEGSDFFDFFGINAGVTVAVPLAKRLQIRTELLFSQNSEAILPISYPRIRYRKIRLNHVELPVHLAILLKKQKGERSIHWRLGGGLAYTYLFHHQATDENGKDVTSDIIYDQRAALLAQADLAYQFAPRYHLNLRMSFPLQSPILDPTLTARVTYQL